MDLINHRVWFQAHKTGGLSDFWLFLYQNGTVFQIPVLSFGSSLVPIVEGNGTPLPHS